MKTIATTSVIALSMAALVGCGQSASTQVSSAGETPTSTTKAATESSNTTTVTSTSSVTSTKSAAKTKNVTSSAKPVVTATPTLGVPKPSGATTKTQRSVNFPRSTGKNHLYIDGISFSEQSWGERITLNFAGDGTPAYKVGYVKQVNTGPNDEAPTKIAGSKILQVRIEGLRLPDKVGELAKVKAPDSGALVQGTTFMPFWEGHSLLHLGLDAKHQFKVHASKTNPAKVFVDIVTKATSTPKPTSDSPGDTKAKASKDFPEHLSDAETHVESITRTSKPWGEQIQLKMFGKGRPAYDVRYVDEIMGGPSEEGDPKFTSKNILLVHLAGLFLPNDTDLLLKAKAPKPQGLIQESDFSPFWEGHATLHLGLAKKHNFTVEAPANSQTITINIYK